jgi:NAD(P)-dependent dehydrogenase (short-subunit alcohol dehydrogenase family)
MNERVAVVTGANRGIGLEVARQLGERGVHVVLGARDPDSAPLSGAAFDTRQLDVTRPEHACALAEELYERYGRLDILVNNAAIHYDTWQHAVDADLTVVREALETNLLGAWQLTQRMLPLLRRSPHPRIVNVSSEAGALTGMTGGTPAYRVSKAGLNALTRMLADELRGDRVLVNAVCPGWVATDMGGPGGRPVADGAAGVVWAAELPDDGPTGGFFRDRRRLDW